MEFGVVQVACGAVVFCGLVLLVCCFWFSAGLALLFSACLPARVLCVAAQVVPLPFLSAKSTSRAWATFPSAAVSKAI